MTCPDVRHRVRDGDASQILLTLEAKLPPITFVALASSMKCCSCAIKLNGVECSVPDASCHGAQSISAPFLPLFRGIVTFIQAISREHFKQDEGIAIAVTMSAHAEAAVEIMKVIRRDRPLLFVCGLMGVTTGLAIVLAHNVCSGGALPIIVTLFGWTRLIKGMLLLVLSRETESRVFITGLGYEQHPNLFAAFALLLGAFMSYSGLNLKQPLRIEKRISTQQSAQSGFALFFTQKALPHERDEKFFHCVLRFGLRGLNVFDFIRCVRCRIRLPAQFGEPAVTHCTMPRRDRSQ